MAFEQVELASVPFVSFIANKGRNGETTNNSFVLRGYVRHWLGHVWSEYDRIKLTDIVATAPQPASEARAQEQAGGARAQMVRRS